MRTPRAWKASEVVDSRIVGTSGQVVITRSYRTFRTPPSFVAQEPRIRSGGPENSGLPPPRLLLWGPRESILYGSPFAGSIRSGRPCVRVITSTMISPMSR